MWAKVRMAETICAGERGSGSERRGQPPMALLNSGKRFTGPGCRATGARLRVSSERMLPPQGSVP